MNKQIMGSYQAWISDELSMASKRIHDASNLEEFMDAIGDAQNAIIFVVRKMITDSPISE